MSQYKLGFQNSALKFMDTITNIKVRQAVMKTCQDLKDDPKPMGYITLKSSKDRTKADEKPAQRVRQGIYRAIYYVFEDLKSIYVVYVDGRDDVYSATFISYTEGHEIMLNTLKSHNLLPKAEEKPKELTRDQLRKINDKKKKRGMLEEIIDFEMM